MDHPNCPHANYTFSDITMYHDTTTGRAVPIIPLVQFLLCVNCHQAVPNPHAIERFQKLTIAERNGVKEYFEGKGYGVDFFSNETATL